jgi:tetratricopeptide (TPR) repeat protein
MRLSDTEALAPAPERDPEEALSTPEENKALENELVGEFFDAGVRAYAAGKSDQAADLFQRVLLLQPSHRGAREALNVLSKSQKPAEEKAAPATRPIDTWVAELNRAVQARRWTAARRWAVRILSDTPDHPVAAKALPQINHELFASACQRARDHERRSDQAGAIRLYKTALGYQTDAAIENRILTLERQIRDDRLSRSEVLYREALAASQEGETEKALRLCGEALELNPNHFSAKRMQLRLQGPPGADAEPTPKEPG